MRIRLLALAAALLFLAGCGSYVHPEDPGIAGEPSSAVPTAVPAAAGVVGSAGLVTILAKDGKPAELCLGGVAMSLPPQCGGPEIVGWDWAEHRGSFEQRSGVRWGEYAVTGTFDGDRFTLKSAIAAALYDPAAGPDEETDLSTPCPEPEGGWKVLDPERTTDQTMQATFAVAEKLPGYADAWVDQSRNPADGTVDPDAMNDPTLLTINVRVTKDAAAAEATLRRTWGGALCVSGAKHTQAELDRIQTEVNVLPGMLSSSGSGDTVDVQVIFDDGSLQAWADETYGKGLVRVSSALVPQRAPASG